VSAARAQLSRLAGAHPLRGRGLPVGALLRRIPPFLALGLAVGALLLLGAWMWFRDSGLVAVRNVEVTGVAGHDADAIARALQRAGEGMSTLHMRPDELRTAVSAYPLVRGIETETDFPHGLRVHVLLEHPAAALVAPDRRVAVTADGKLLPRVSTAGLPTVGVHTDVAGPQIDSARVRGAVAALGATPGPLRSRVEGARWTASKGLVLALRDGPDLYFGNATRLAAKWMSAVRVLADPTSAGAKYVDVRVPERPAAGGVSPGDPQAEAQSGTTAAAQAAAGPTAPVTPVQTTPATSTPTPAQTTPQTPVQTTPQAPTGTVTQP
jgi:cell division protein FtsQ